MDLPLKQAIKKYRKAHGLTKEKRNRIVLNLIEHYINGNIPIIQNNIKEWEGGCLADTDDSGLLGAELVKLNIMHQERLLKHFQHINRCARKSPFFRYGEYVKKLLLLGKRGDHDEL